jgi:transposase-like protein
MEKQEFLRKWFDLLPYLEPAVRKDMELDLDAFEAVVIDKMKNGRAVKKCPHCGSSETMRIKPYLTPKGYKCMECSSMFLSDNTPV